MHSFFFVLALLILVTVIYVFAYRMGYKDAQTKALFAVREVAEPVSCLLDQLNETLDEAADNKNRQKDDDYPPEGATPLK
ncbi:MAG: hypothetical protein KJP23_26760 [Deltaproteobacteria bacterium]|nr:hypothetical protein [Deltaproteobacteria bacterium]